MNMDLFSLNDRVVLITGAAGHLGGALAEAAAEAGAHVVLNGRNKSRLDSLAARLNGAGSVAVSRGDLTRDAYLKSLVSLVQKTYGRLDVILNNAYDSKTALLENTSRQDFRKKTDVGLIAPFRLVQIALPILRKTARKSKQSVSVINMASMYGSVSPDPRLYARSGQNSPPFYGAVKGGLLQLTRYLSVHLAPDNIRVNAISPGPFPSTVKNRKFIANLKNNVPMNRIGTPDELKGAFLFLASEASSYVTGINLPVDGGWTAW